MDEHPTNEGTISLSTAKLIFGESPSKMKRLVNRRNGNPLQEDLFSNGAARSVKRRAPKMPLEDNTPEGMQALLAANRHYRQVPGPRLMIGLRIACTSVTHAICRGSRMVLFT